LEMVGRRASIVVVFGSRFGCCSRSTTLRSSCGPALEKEFRIAMTDVMKISVPERNELSYGQLRWVT